MHVHDLYDYNAFKNIILLLNIMFFTNVFKMSHRHLVPYISKMQNFKTKNIEINSQQLKKQFELFKLKHQFREQEIENYHLQLKNSNRYMK